MDDVSSLPAIVHIRALPSCTGEVTWNQSLHCDKNYLKWQKSSSTHVLLDIIEGAEFMTCTIAHHQGVFKMFWLYFWCLCHSSLHTVSGLSSTSSFWKQKSWHWSEIGTWLTRKGFFSAECQGQVYFKGGQFILIFFFKTVFLSSAIERFDRQIPIWIKDMVYVNKRQRKHLSVRLKKKKKLFVWHRSDPIKDHSEWYFCSFCATVHSGRLVMISVCFSQCLPYSICSC